MNLDEVEQLLSVARVVYQVELAGDQDHLVDASEMELAICPPGCQGPDEEYRPELWAVGLGEQGTHRMVVCTGSTLAEAFAALRDRVDARCAMLRGSRRHPPIDAVRFEHRSALDLRWLGAILHRGDAVARPPEHP